MHAKIWANRNFSKFCLVEKAGKNIIRCQFSTGANQCNRSSWRHPINVLLSRWYGHRGRKNFDNISQVLHFLAHTIRMNDLVWLFCYFVWCWLSHRRSSSTHVKLGSYLSFKLFHPDPYVRAEKILLFDIQGDFKALNWQVFQSLRDFILFAIDLFPIRKRSYKKLSQYCPTIGIRMLE